MVHTMRRPGYPGAIAAEVRAELARQGLSVRELAETAGLPVRGLQRQLRDGNVPDYALDPICSALGLPTGVLLFRAGHILAAQERT